jgi:hypothetical protein
MRLLARHVRHIPFRAGRFGFPYRVERVAGLRKYGVYRKCAAWFPSMRKQRNFHQPGYKHIIRLTGWSAKFMWQRRKRQRRV